MNSQNNVTQSIFFIVSVLAIITCSISACTSSPTQSETPIISSDKAIEIAVGGCKIPHLVLVGEPHNIQTKLLTLEEADKLTGAEGETTNYGIPMDTKVWLVQMDGQLQLVGGPVAIVTEDSRVVTQTPPKPFEGTCSVIIHASSGSIIVIRG